MRIKRTDAGTMPELDKAEVRCLMDGVAIIEACQAIKGNEAMNTVIERIGMLAKCYGGS